MLKENDKIKVHMFNDQGKEIKTAVYDKVFEVIKKNSRLGIYWKDDEFAPFETFSHTVIFENIETNKKYYYSNIYSSITEVI